MLEIFEIFLIDLKDFYDVSYLICYLVDEDEEDLGNEDFEFEKNLDLVWLGISLISYVEGIVNLDDCFDIDLGEGKILKVFKYIILEEF